MIATNTMTKLKIMVVDDEAANRRLLERTLSPDYDVLSAENGEACLASLESFTPDIFLLDVLMPGGMDGFTLCKSIREQGKFRKTLIIFLSALDSLDKKLNDYEVGADDYVTKPIELGVLLAKIKQQSQRIQEAELESQSAMSIAMTAMSNGGELGEIKNFYENIHQCTSYESLAEHVINTCDNFSLNAAIQIRQHGVRINRSTTGNVNPLEQELMTTAQNADRIYSFGIRCLFNFTNATLLIRRMPEDMDKAGRFRDHLASLMNGVEGRMYSLRTELALKAQNETAIVKALKDTHCALDDIMVSFKTNDINIRGIIDHLFSELSLAFSYLDLEQEQEEYLMNVVDKCLKKITEQSSEGLEIDRNFEKVIDSLQGILKAAHQSS